MKRTIIFFAIALCAMGLWAKPIDNAKALYNEGRYEEAVTALKAILKSSPRDITANYYLGLSYAALGETDKAIAPLELAEDRGSASASQALAGIAFDEYRMDDASRYIDRWEKQLRKNKKGIPDELDELRTRVVSAKNMLERVEKIAIIDSITVDKDDFFAHYRLSADAGKLLDGNILPPNYASQKPSVVFVPETNREVFWASPDARTGLLALQSAQILDDGTFERPEPVGDALGEDGDADYMWLASDGVTFYFANNGPNSLGGYDIFMSRRDSDGNTLIPQNMGMPYNSAFDDYMLVIDETAGLGWWATDRNQIPGKVTIYTFVPNAARINYSPDDPNLADYAFIKSIEATQSSAIDREALLNNPALAEQGSQGGAEAFELSLGDGRVYSSLSQFKSPQARQAMQQYLDRTKDLRLMKSQLSVMRRRYGQGDNSVEQEILALEKRVLSAEAMLVKLRNQAIQYEGR